MPLRELSIASKTVVLSSLGALLCSLDSAFNVAFPAVSRWFGISPNGITLLVVLYHIPLAALTIGGGILGDRFGHRRLFAAGLWISAIAFPLCGLAPTYSFLVGARILQGIGAGFVFGTSPALITLAVPARDTGLGLGVLNFAAGVGLAGAPLVGGVLIDLFGWPSVFLFRIPLAAVLAFAALPWVRGYGRMLEARAGIYAVAPVPPRALISNALALLANAAFFVIYMLGPYYLVQVLGYSATLSGFVFMLVPLSTAVAGPLSGAFLRVTRAKNIVAAGLALQVVGLGLVALLRDQSSLTSTAVAFAAAGFGIGAFQVPNMAIVMAALPGRLQGFAGGMVSTMRTLGIIAGAALGPWLFETRQRAHLAAAPSVATPFVRAFNETFAACAALTALAFLLSLALHARPRAE